MSTQYQLYLFGMVQWYNLLPLRIPNSKPYSDYIRYPIVMDVEQSKLKEGTGVDGVDPEYDTVIETKTLNSIQHQTDR